VLNYRARVGDNRGVAPWPEREEPDRWEATLARLQPLRVEPVKAGSEAARRWAFYLRRYGWGGPPHPLGEPPSRHHSASAGRTRGCRPAGDDGTRAACASHRNCIALAYPLQAANQSVNMAGVVGPAWTMTR
jgi:hypothetical protein